MKSMTIRKIHHFIRISSVAAALLLSSTLNSLALFDDGQHHLTPPLESFALIEITNGPGFDSSSPETITVPNSLIQDYATNPTPYLALNDVELITNDVLDQLVADYETNALALYTYVLNHIDYNSAPFIRTEKCVKGALGCYLEEAGNDVDLSALTIYLLRRCNIPCAYGYLTYPRIDSSTYFQIYGFDVMTNNVEDPYRAYPITNAIVYAYLSNDDGATTNWIPLIPWYKEREIKDGVYLRTILSNHYQTVYAVLNAFAHATDPDIEMAVAATSDQFIDWGPVWLDSILSNDFPDVSLDQVGAQWKLKEQYLDNWPSNYSIYTYGSSYCSSAPTLTTCQYENIHFKLQRKSDSYIYIDHTIRTTELHNRRVTFQFKPYDTNDISWAKYFGFYGAANKFGTNYRLLPTLSIGGAPQFLSLVITGAASSRSDAVCMGDLLTLLIDNTTNTIIAGEVQSVGFYFGNITERMLDQHYKDLQEISTYTKRNSTLTWESLQMQDFDILSKITSMLGMNYYYMKSKFDKMAGCLTKMRVLDQAMFGFFNFSLETVNSNYEAGTIGIDLRAESHNSQFLHLAMNTEVPQYHVNKPEADLVDYSYMNGISGSSFEAGAIERTFGIDEANSSFKTLRKSVQSGAGITNLTYYTYNTSANISLMQSVDMLAYESVTTFFAVHTNGNVWFPCAKWTVNGYTNMGWIEVDHNLETWGGSYQINNKAHGGHSPYIPAAAMSANDYGQGGNNTAISDTVPVNDYLNVYVGNNNVGIDYAGMNGSSASANQLSSVGDSQNDQTFIDSLVGNTIAGLTDYREGYLNDQATFYGTSTPGGGETLDAATLSAIQTIVDNGAVGEAISFAWQSGFDNVADPVDTRSGEFYEECIDLVIPGPKPIEIKRYYTSQYGAIGEFGFGWRFNHASYLAVGTNEIRIVEPQGTALRLAPDPSVTNQWIPTVELNQRLANLNSRGIGSVANPYTSRLTYNEGTGAYVYTGPSGETRTFENMQFSDGTILRDRPYLTEWCDANSNRLLYAYGMDSNRFDYGRIVEVRNEQQFAKLKYNRNGRLYEVRCSDGRVLRYEYDEAGDLVAAYRPDKTAVKYDYLTKTATNGAYSTHLIFRVTKAEGRVIENVYDDQRRVIEQWATVGITANPERNAVFTYIGDGINGKTIISNILGAAEIYTYSNGLVVSIEDDLGFVVSNTWDAANNLIKHVDKRGIETRYLYDTHGNTTNIMLIGDICGLGNTETSETWYTYTTNNLVASIRGNRGEVTRNCYDANRNLVTQELCYADSDLNPANNVLYSRTILQHDSHGWLTNRITAVGTDDEATTSYTYDSNGNLHSQITYPNYWTGSWEQDPVTLTNFYNERGWLTKQIKGTGRYDEFSYDTLGHVIRRKSYSSEGILRAKSEFKYDEAGNLIEKKGPLAFNGASFLGDKIDDTVSNNYDRMDHLLNSSRRHYHSSCILDTTFGEGGESGWGYSNEFNGVAITRYEFDGFGNLTQTCDALTNITRYTCDALGRVIHTTNYQGQSETVLAHTHQWYDGEGLVVSNQNARGFVTHTSYNALRKPLRIDYPDGTYEQWRYDAAGLLTQFISTANISTFYQYNDFGQQTNCIEAAGTIDERNISSAYDRRGNRIMETDAEGYTTIWQYDDVNRAVEIYYPTGSSPQRVVANLYDAENRLTTHYEADSIVCYQYNDLGQCSSKWWYDRSPSVEKVYSEYYYYNSAGDMLCKVMGGVETNRYAYDESHNRTHRVSISPEPQYDDPVYYTWKYDLKGNRIDEIHPNGIRHSYEFDGLNRPVCMHEYNTVGQAECTINYNYDACGNVTNEIYPYGVRHARDYDSRNRITQERIYVPANGEYLCNSFYYDNAGNISTQITPRNIRIISEYDNLNRKTGSQAIPPDESTSPLSRTMTYSPNGWLSSVTEGDVIINHSRDQYGRALAETCWLGDDRSDFNQTFNADGQRISSSVSPGDENWTYQWGGPGILSNISWAGHYSMNYDSQRRLMWRIHPNVSMSNYRTYRNQIWMTRWLDNRPINELEVYIDYPEYEQGTAGSDIIDYHSFSYNGYRVNQESLPYCLPYSAYKYNYLCEITNEVFYPQGEESPTKTNHYSYTYDTLSARTSMADNRSSGSLIKTASVDQFRRLRTETANSTGGFSAITIAGMLVNGTSVVVCINGTNLGYAAIDTNLHLWSMDDVYLIEGSNIIAATAAPGYPWATTTTARVTLNLTTGGSYTYDAAGNMVAFNRNGISSALAYDALDRLSLVVQRDGSGNGINWTATYDPLGRRIATSCQSISNNIPASSVVYTRSIYDVDYPMQETVLVTENGSSATTNVYLYGLDKSGQIGGMGGVGGLLAIKSNGQIQDVINDVRGNVLGTINSSFNCTWNPRYTAFGPVSTPTINAPSFSTRRRDPTGLYYFGARYYDPQTGLFTQPDPARFTDSRNLYAFCANNPMTRSDPNGRLSTSQQNTFSFHGNYTANGSSYYADQDYSGSGLNAAIELEQNYTEKAALTVGSASLAGGIAAEGVALVGSAIQTIAASAANHGGVIIGMQEAMPTMIKGGALVGQAMGLTQISAPTPGYVVPVESTSYLYQKIGADGEHLKYGITKNPSTRYTQKQLNGGELRIIAEGNKSEMLLLERTLHETMPIGAEEGQAFYIQKQVESGLQSSPYN
ncbi:MAG: hypothetical protein EOM20_00020 [Spartobacteria bacterium]|nr:hypothetical protein [Spartobacteria bacterium]